MIDILMTPFFWHVNVNGLPCIASTKTDVWYKAIGQIQIYCWNVIPKSLLWMKINTYEHFIAKPWKLGWSFFLITKVYWYYIYCTVTLAVDFYSTLDHDTGI